MFHQLLLILATFIAAVTAKTSTIYRQDLTECTDAVLSSDKVVVVMCATQSGHTALLTLSPNGEVTSQKEYQLGLDDTPISITAMTSGVAICGSVGVKGFLASIKANGVLGWSIVLDDPCTQVTSFGGSLYIGLKYQYAKYTADGELVWQRYLNSGSTLSVMTVVGEMIWMGGAQGTVMWMGGYSPNGVIKLGPVTVDDTTIMAIRTHPQTGMPWVVSAFKNVTSSDITVTEYSTSMTALSSVAYGNPLKNEYPTDVIFHPTQPILFLSGITYPEQPSNFVMKLKTPSMSAMTFIGINDPVNRLIYTDAFHLVMVGSAVRNQLALGMVMVNDDVLKSLPKGDSNVLDNVHSAGVSDGNFNFGLIIGVIVLCILIIGISGTVLARQYYVRNKPILLPSTSQLLIVPGMIEDP
jgi:hypothetical protein